MKLKTGVASKTKLSSTLKSWFPLLQASVSDLEEKVHEFASENPFIDVKSNFSKDFSSSFKKRRDFTSQKAGLSDKIESLSTYKNSLYEKLYEQISPPLFPTKISSDIALEIIEDINDEGYFEGDEKKIAQRYGVDISQVEKIRARFAYLEPSGIGAKSIKESLFFQLTHLDIDSELYESVKLMIDNLENIRIHSERENFQEAKRILKNFKNPPAIEFLQKDSEVIPDIFVFNIDDMIEVRLNDSLYPTINIDNQMTLDMIKKDSYIKSKIKEAKDLVDALDMRKATLYKIGLMIVEYQYDFFTGGAIKPMKLKDLAEEFGHAPSTISRAISNKYLECDRGVVPIKSFFSAAIDEDVSNAAIKEFINELIKDESRARPLSDIKILEAIEERFEVKMVRRTITKYRKQLNIASSSERKKLYEMSV
ncbi:MAG: RNA polymerase factor sigma-54 [Campylobacterales bacterium]